MVITRDYARLESSNTRITTNLIQNQHIVDNDDSSTTPVNITKNIFMIPRNL